MRRVDDRRLGVEEAEHTLRRRHRGLHDVVLLREVADGLEEAVDQLPEREKRSDRHLAFEDPEATRDEESGARRGARETDGGKEHRHRADLAAIGVQQIGIQVVELLKGRALTCEELNDRHTREVLVQIRVDAREADADRSERVAHDSSEVHRQPDEQGQRGEGDERETEVQHKQHDRDHPDDHEVAEDRDDPLRDHVGQRVDVVGDPRHQSADRIPVEERERESLQVREELHAQVVHGLLPDVAREHRLPVAEARTHDKDGDVREAERSEARQSLVDPDLPIHRGSDRVVDDELREDRRRRLGDRDAQDDD